MSENAKSQTNTVVIVLVVAVVVLAVGLGYYIWSQNQAVPEVTSLPAGSAGAATGDTAATTPGSTGTMPGATSSEPVAFDPKTATKVPKGTAPADFVKAYHEAVMKGKYEDAYKMLPLDKQKSYGDAASYGQQVAAYGITSYELTQPKETGDTWTVVATQVTPQMPIAYTWTLKKVGGEWYVASRTMGGQ